MSGTYTGNLKIAFLVYYMKSPPPATGVINYCAFFGVYCLFCVYFLIIVYVYIFFFFYKYPEKKKITIRD